MQLCHLWNDIVGAIFLRELRLDCLCFNQGTFNVSMTLKEPSISVEVHLAERSVHFIGITIASSTASWRLVTTGR